MKKIVLLLTLSFSVLSIKAITVDEILKNYFENTGGVALWQKMQTVKMEGNVPSPQGDFPFIFYQKTPNKLKVEVDIQGKKMIPQCYDGKIGWTLNPFAGGSTASKMTEEEIKELEEEAVFEPEYINYKEKGHEITLEGEEVIDGVNCYKLKVHKNKNNDKDDSVEYHYFDTENFVPIMTSTTVKTGPSKGTVTETYYSDYQETEFGVIMPYYMETKMSGQTVSTIVIENVIVNGEMEDSLFEMPATE
ncbi:MAG: outer membrane lipoprotein-sorting protein [Schleiferiaceae bacterium]|jgi:outer membrane lipoprotein-sorting protein|nr:outer membrane lipoprotein-sorting protein [Schleiferiaceae bacterium]